MEEKEKMGIFMRKEEEEELLAGGIWSLSCQWVRIGIDIEEASFYFIRDNKGFQNIGL